MTRFKVQRKNGQVQEVDASSLAEAISVVEQMDASAAPAPIVKQGGGSNATISERKRGFLESAGEQLGDIATSTLEMPGAIVDAVKTVGNPYEPQKALQFMKDTGGGIVDAVKNRLGLLKEGRPAEFLGRTAVDAATAVLPNKLGKMARPAESVAGGSPILQKAESLGIRPKRQAFGLRDKLAADPLSGAPGDPRVVLKKSVEQWNAEAGKMGAAPLEDIHDFGQLKRASSASVDDLRASRVKEAIQGGQDAVVGKFGPRPDPATVGDDFVARVKKGRDAAANTLGPAVEAAKAPFLDEVLPADELARVAGKYGQEFPGVTDATGKLLFDEGGGANLTYRTVDDIKRKLGYAGSEKNKAASALSRELQDTSLKTLEDRGLDVSKIREANANYASTLGRKGMYGKGRPGQILRGAVDSGNTAKALDIPLTEGRAWEQVMASLDDPVKYGGGEAAAIGGTKVKEAVRRRVIYENMGLNNGVEAFQKSWSTASPRMKAAVFGPGEMKAVDDILAKFSDKVSAAKGLQPSRDMQILREVWDQYSPTQNVADSSLLPHTYLGLTKLLAAHLATRSVSMLRKGLYQATRLGRPAMLYNLVAAQTRIERKRQKEESANSQGSFEDFMQSQSQEEQP